MVTIERPGPIDPRGPCANTRPTDDQMIVSLPDSKYDEYLYTVQYTETKVTGTVLYCPKVSTKVPVLPWTKITSPEQRQMFVSCNHQV